MLESDRLPNNVMKVPEVYSLYCQSSYREGERGEGRKREGGEERRGGGGRGRGRERGEKGRKREGGEEGRYICCIVTMSLCLCSDVKKN